MKRALVGAVAIAGCASSSGAGGTSVGDPTGTAESTASPSAPAAISTPVSSSAGPRAWDLSRGAARLHIVDKPGFLVDSNAPPPPPGAKVEPHPFLSGSCSGDPLACSEAGQALRAAKSTDEFIDAMKKAGFDVKPTSP